MLQLRYNTEFLDIDNSQQYEVTRNSPLFLLDDIMAEYSTPLTIKYSDKNARLLGFMFFDNTVKTKLTVDVQVFVNGTFRCHADLIVESAGMNRVHAYKSNLVGYLKTGISSFFTLVKDQLLSSLSFGGDREYEYTSDDPTDGSGGLWQQLDGLYDFSGDFVCPPVRNLALVPADDIECCMSEGIMNRYDGYHIGANQPVYPFPKLSYVMACCFSEKGWALDTSAITDTEFAMLILYTNYNVSTARYTFDGTTYFATPLSSITIQLSQAVPPTYTIAQFILQICKRYFLFPLCDNATRTCRLIPLKDVANTPAVKDWTRYTGSPVNSDFTIPAKIFAFKTTFKGDDQYPAAPSFTNWLIGPSFGTQMLLPPADETYDNKLLYTHRENKWWKIAVDPTDGSRSWEVFADNIYDADAENATDTYETEVSTLPMLKHPLETADYALLPLVNQLRKSSWGIRTLLYTGMQKQTDNVFSPHPTRVYPQATSLYAPAAGFPKLAWSNVLHHVNADEFGKDYGLVEYWYKAWLEVIASPEVVTENFYLPYHEILQYQWTDIILVNNVPFFLRSFVETMGSKPYIQATLQKIKLRTQDVPAPPPDDEAFFSYFDILTEAGSAYEALQHFTAPAGADVTFEITSYSASTGGFFLKIDGVTKVLHDTFTVTADGSGDGFFQVSIGGVSTPGNVFTCQITITATTIGTIGTPDVQGHHKTT